MVQTGGISAFFWESRSTDDCQTMATTHALVQSAVVTSWALHPYEQTKASIAAASLSFAASLCLTLLFVSEHDRSIRPSSLIVTYLLLAVIFDATQIRTLFLQGVDLATTLLVCSSVALKLLLLVIESYTKKPWLSEHYQSLPPESTSGIINRSFFWWLNNLFSVGYRRILAPGDLYSVDERLNSKSSSSTLEDTYNHTRTHCPMLPHF